MVEKISTSRRHPGRGTGHGRVFNRGRQVDAAARLIIAELLGDRPRRRDLLIEYLHLVQDHFGHISARVLAALAEALNVSQAEAYEVATFYAHFDLVPEDETPPPAITVRVCESLSCALAGSDALLTSLAERLPANEVRVVAAPCMGRCDTAPIAAVGQHHVESATTAAVAAAVTARKTQPAPQSFVALEQYLAHGGYRLLQACRDGTRSFADISGELSRAGLRGLGGAGFPTADKWTSVREAAGAHLLVVNADEGEPGTFKDRYYLERDPHRFLEGMLIAAWAVAAEKVFIYLRDEYPGLRLTLQNELRALAQRGLIAAESVELRRGAGAYVCGEESAMIESIEGKRGYPRERPPYVAEVGLFGQPTLVNNVETLYWVRDIVDNGADWFGGQGRHGGRGLRSYSVSGRVTVPGVHLAPAGITLLELIDEYCGGMAQGHTLRAYLPGGASGGILPAALADLPLDFGTLESQGCFIGSAAVIVLSQADDLKSVARNLTHFFAEESCGQCTPCRAGTQKLLTLLQPDTWDTDLISELSQVMGDASICGLGHAAANPAGSLIRHFAEQIGAAEIIAKG